VYLVSSGEEPHTSREDDNPLKTARIDSVFKLTGFLLTILNLVSSHTQEMRRRIHQPRYRAVPNGSSGESSAPSRRSVSAS